MADLSDAKMAALCGILVGLLVFPAVLSFILEMDKQWRERYERLHEELSADETLKAVMTFTVVASLAVLFVLILILLRERTRMREWEKYVKEYQHNKIGEGR